MRRVVWLAVAWGLGTACGEGSGEPDDGGAAEDGRDDAGGDAADSGPDGDVPEASGDDGGAGEDAETGDDVVETDDGDPGDGGYEPTAESVDLAVGEPLPSGDWILFNDWAAEPNRVLAVRPEGSDLREVLTIARAWSLGASRDGRRLAVAGAQYDEGSRWGLGAFGDAVQYTWLVDLDEGSVRLLAGGNVNDECHRFVPGDGAVLVCRRYDFRFDGDAVVYDGYRAGRLDLGGGAIEWLTEAGVQALNPEPAPDGSRLFYTHFEYVGGSPRFRVMSRNPADGAETVVRERARGWVFSPDGSRVLFRDLADGGRLHVMSPDGSGEVAVTRTAAQGGAFSPDGERVVYLNPAASGTAHLEIVRADGSDADTPARVRDAETTGEVITQAAWIRRP